MKIIRGFTHIPTALQSCVITLGNFDGVHHGHQHLIHLLKKMGEQKNLPTVLMLFEPQPAEFFDAAKSPSRLTTFKEKQTQIAKLGVDFLLVTSFNQTLAKCSANEFIEQFLIKKLNAKHIIIGDDFKFGAHRVGDKSLLAKYAEKGLFEFESLPTYQIDNSRVSSTAIRQALAQSDFLQAKKLLGRAYTITGRVVHGNKLARQLGFPTANIHLKRKNPALRGVYLVSVRDFCQNKTHQGIANIGIRPTVNGKHAVLEVNIFDFDQEIYGNELEIEFIEKIRDEHKFESLDALKSQIKQDICIANQIRAKLS